MFGCWTSYKHYFIRNSHFLLGWLSVRIRCGRCHRRRWRAHCSILDGGCIGSWLDDRWHTIRWLLWENGWHRIWTGIICKMHGTNVRSILHNGMAIVFSNCLHPFGTESVILWESIHQRRTPRETVRTLHLIRIIGIGLLLEHLIGRLARRASLHATADIMQYREIHWCCGTLQFTVRLKYAAMEMNGTHLHILSRHKIDYVSSDRFAPDIKQCLIRWHPENDQMKMKKICRQNVALQEENHVLCDTYGWNVIFLIRNEFDRHCSIQHPCRFCILLPLCCLIFCEL